MVRPICYDRNSHQLRTVEKFSWCHNLSFRYSVLSFKLALRDLPKFHPLGKNIAACIQVLYSQAGSTRSCGIFHLDLPGYNLQALHDLCLLVHDIFALCIQLLGLFWVDGVCFRSQFMEFPRVLQRDFPSGSCTTCFWVLSSIVSKYYLDVWFMYISTHVSIYQNTIHA